jgi:ABC-2 type transport system ATP-binding protein
MAPGRRPHLPILRDLLLPTSGSVHVLEEDMRRHRDRVLPRLTPPVRRSAASPDSAAEPRDLRSIIRPAGGVASGSRNWPKNLPIHAFLDPPSGKLSAGQKRASRSLKPC